MLKKIGLRPKMLLALAIGIILLFGLTFFVARTSLLQGYSQLEDEKVKIQIDAAINLLSEQAYQLDFTARDSARSDDLHQYVATPNSAYINANWNDNAQINLKVNAVLIVNNQGKVLHQSGLDYSTGKPWLIPNLLMQAISKGGALVNPAKTSISGLFWTPEGVLLISAFGILHSSDKGPRNGTLILARLIDQDLLNHIEIILDAKLALKAMPNNEILAISPQLEFGEVVKPLSNNQVAGYTLIEPIGGNKKLVLSIISDRKIFKLTESSIKFLYGAAVLAALLLGVFSWIFDKLVLKKLAHLNESVIHIGQSGLLAKRISAPSGNDEINSLAQGINSMLARLDDSQHALQFEKERAQVTLAGIADAVITTDNTGHVTYMNTAAERLTGLLCKDVSSQSLQSIFKLMAEDESKRVDSAWLTDLASPLDEVMFEREDGQKFVLTKSASPLYNEDKHLFSTVTVLHDVTMLRKLSKQLSYQARHDQLTGLVNRYEFDHKLQEAIDDSATEGRTHCLACFDLDRFKIVNDTCGHNAGDLLLRQLSNQLKQKVRNTDTLARLGGDEFGLLLSGCDINRAYQIMESLLQVVQDYRFTTQDKVFKIGASFGLTKISINQTLTLSEVFSTVDSACYAAKAAGGNRIHVHNHNDDTVKHRTSQQNWVSHIQQAIEKNQFELHAQTIQSLSGNQEDHCELLIRLRDDDGTIFPPGAFLPAAERYHLMPQIDRWVINEALHIMARKGDSFKTTCGINLSGQSFSDERLLEYIITQINHHGIDASRLCFEITETAVISSIDQARQFIQGLRALGCRFSLDDFGSGMSSFAYLKNLEVDFLKIDGMFVKSIASNKIDRAMLESINNIGHVMNLKTIAECAENQEVIDVLKEIGVDFAQGYGVEMPKLFE